MRSIVYYLFWIAIVEKVKWKDIESRRSRREKNRDNRVNLKKTKQKTSVKILIVKMIQNKQAIQVHEIRTMEETHQDQKAKREEKTINGKKRKARLQTNSKTTIAGRHVSCVVHQLGLNWQ